MDLQSISEIVSGLVLDGTIPAHSVDATHLEAPYDRMIKAFAKSGSTSDAAEAGGVMAYTASMGAVSSVGPDDPYRWVKMLDNIYSRVMVAKALEPKIKLMKMGDPVDIPWVMNQVSKLDSGTSDWDTMDKVEPANDMWKPTGWKALDTHLGGMPKFGLILVGAAPGSGKTTMLTQLADSMTKQGNKFAMLSLEMTKELIMARWVDVNPKVTKKQRSLLRVSDGDYDIDEACASMSRIVAEDPDIYALGLDYADMLIPPEREESTAIASRTYLMLAKTARRIQRPIWCLSQLSDKYIGGLPQVNHIRYSRLAEAAASMILLLYNPDQIFVDQGQRSKNQRLEAVPGMAYIIQGKSRHGYKNDGVGAIQLPWLKKGGWGPGTGNWFPLGSAA